MLKKLNFIFFKISLVKTLYYSIKFKSKIFVGKGTVVNLHKNSKIIVNSGKLLLGHGFSLPAKSVLDIYDNGSLIINGNVQICNGTKIMIAKNATLKIGANTTISENSRVQCRKEIEIGNECAISWSVHILDSDAHPIIIDGIKKPYTKKVTIGNKVLVGCRSTILKGVEIGDGSVVASCSTVTKSILPKSLVNGIPAKVVKENVEWSWGDI